MHWKTRYGDGRDRPQHNHLGDDGEECGCFSDDSWDGWTTNIKRRKHVVCETHKRREEKLRARLIKQSIVIKAYNKDTTCRIKELDVYVMDVRYEYYRDFERKILDIEDDMVPIKYLREYDRKYVNYDTWFNIQKIRNRYYCCNNKIKYHMDWKSKMEIGMKRKRERFMLYKGWTTDDLTTRSYEWIEDNDKTWLKEYKNQLRLNQIHDDECAHLIRMLESWSPLN